MCVDIFSARKMDILGFQWEIYDIYRECFLIERKVIDHHTTILPQMLHKMRNLNDKPTNINSISNMRLNSIENLQGLRKSYKNKTKKQEISKNQKSNKNKKITERKTTR